MGRPRAFLIVGLAGVYVYPPRESYIDETLEE
jgi:hypothetical protein